MHLESNSGGKERFDPVAQALQKQFNKENESLSEQLASANRRSLITNVPYELVQHEDFLHRQKLKQKYICLNKTPPSAVAGSSSNAGHKDSDGEALKPAETVLWNPANVQLGWTGKYPIGRGMLNVGNTCFLNATLQSLVHCSPFVNFLLNESGAHSSGRNAGSCLSLCLLCAMRDVMKTALSNGGGPFKPAAIVHQLKAICKNMSHGRQEDAHEFLAGLLDGMGRHWVQLVKCKYPHALDKQSKETTPIHQIFGGYIRSQVRCLRCKHASNTYEYFQQILLDLPPGCGTLLQCLDHYFQKEKLEGLNAYKCASCKQHVTATKQFSIATHPKVLTIQLKRFTNSLYKNNRKIGYDAHLDLSRHIPPGHTRIRYHLTAMIIHSGSSSIQGGHYTAIAKAANNQFYYFDDSRVSQCSLSSVLDQSPYVIFYELSDLSPRPNTPGKQDNHTPAKATSENKLFGNGLNTKISFQDGKINRLVPRTVSANASKPTAITPVKIPVTPTKPPLHINFTHKPGASGSKLVVPVVKPAVPVNKPAVPVNKPVVPVTKPNVAAAKPPVNHFMSHSTSPLKPQLVPYDSESDSSDEDSSLSAKDSSTEKVMADKSYTDFRQDDTKCDKSGSSVYFTASSGSSSSAPSSASGSSPFSNLASSSRCGEKPSSTSSSFAPSSSSATGSLPLPNLGSSSGEKPSAAPSDSKWQVTDGSYPQSVNSTDSATSTTSWTIGDHTRNEVRNTSPGWVTSPLPERRNGVENSAAEKSEHNDTNEEFSCNDKTPLIKENGQGDRRLKCNGDKPKGMVSRFLTMNGRGYGNNVKSWSGGDNSVDSRAREDDSKRRYESSYDDELMDQGRTKKIRSKESRPGGIMENMFNKVQFGKSDRGYRNYDPRRFFGNNRNQNRGYRGGQRPWNSDQRSWKWNENGYDRRQSYYN